MLYLFHNELYLLRERFIFFSVHLRLVHQIDHNHLSSLHSTSYFLFLFISYLFTTINKSSRFLVSHITDNWMKFCLFCFSSFLMTFFLMLRVIQISLYFLDLLFIFLCSGLTFISTMLFISNKFIHSFLKHILERIRFWTKLSLLLFQHYKRIAI